MCVIYGMLGVNISMQDYSLHEFYLLVILRIAACSFSLLIIVHTVKCKRGKEIIMFCQH